MSVCVFVRVRACHSLNCVFPGTPVSLIQLLHVQSELRQAELVYGQLVLGPTGQRGHTLGHC